ncbi:hypothetical protein [Natronohydrobacter thiooxidans]|uniref:hypothetical protein n=1 Tax=Natronohydrobacter thiooxidans TaxID=87172 RepID=UPI001587E047|nr:hypothetical protein [Natronohydrobacter thiooxidans]
MSHPGGSASGQHRIGLIRKFFQLRSQIGQIGARYDFAGQVRNARNRGDGQIANDRLRRRIGARNIKQGRPLQCVYLHLQPQSDAQTPKISLDKLIQRCPQLLHGVLTSEEQIEIGFVPKFPHAFGKLAVQLEKRLDFGFGRVR